jgi:hypothetical protein
MRSAAVPGRSNIQSAEDFRNFLRHGVRKWLRPAPGAPPAYPSIEGGLAVKNPLFSRLRRGISHSARQLRVAKKLI